MQIFYFVGRGSVPLALCCSKVNCISEFAKDKIVELKVSVCQDFKGGTEDKSIGYFQGS